MINYIKKGSNKRLNNFFSKINLLIYLSLFLLINFPINKALSETKKEISVEYLNSKDSLDYILGARDILRIKLSDYLPELTRSVIVQPSGHISLPKIKNIYVKDLTIDELTDLLTKKYSRILISSNIDIRLIRERPVKVYISGEVESPGLYTLYYGGIDDQKSQLELKNNPAEGIKISEEFSPKTDFPTLYGLIQKSGGVTLRSDIENIEILRKNSFSNGGGKIKATVNLLSLIESGEFSNNLRLYDGDYISIGKKNNDDLKLLKKAVMSNLNPKNIKVFLSGKIQNPGPVLAAKQSTLNDAILLAGGKRAITGKINFVRINNDGSFEKRKFSYKNNASRGSYRNPFLKNGDFIIVGRGAIGTFNEVLSELTQPFVGIYSVLELYDEFTE